MESSLVSLTSRIDKEYSSQIEQEFKDRKGYDIPNSTIDHNLLVSSLIIRNTESRLRILAKSSEEINYEEINQSILYLDTKLGKNKNTIIFENRILNFLRSVRRLPSKEVSPELRILFSDTEEYGSSKFYGLLKNCNYVKIKRFRKQNPQTPSFIVSDNNTYNLFEKKEEDGRIAKANCNDELKANILEKFFDDCWKLEDRLITLK
ncbi:MAG: hypothetical protein V1660_00915 [archaeon]